MKIYIALNDYNIDAIVALKKAGYTLVINDKAERPKEEELCQIVKEYDGIIIGAKEKLTQSVYNNIGRLRLIGTLSVGLDHIDKLFFNNSNISILNCPNSNVASTAEHAICLILALLKKLNYAKKSIAERSGRKGLHGFARDLRGKRVGVIGAGRIGSRVIQVLKNFECDISCWTKNINNHRDLLDDNVVFSELNELLRSSDIITIHLPLTDDTVGILDCNRLGLLKHDSIFINTARAGLVDNLYLSQLVKNNPSFGCGLDYDIEDDTTIELFETFDNVIITPHSAGVSIDAMNRMDLELASYLVDFIHDIA